MICSASRRIVELFVHGRGHSVPHESRELMYGFFGCTLEAGSGDCRATGKRVTAYYQTFVYATYASGKNVITVYHAKPAAAIANMRLVKDCQ